ncbi:phospholipase D-like domain-containing protein [Aquabacterium sp. A7-Y]|uniref:phospholipase D-like domain-containing protein n=1 Tax=Aquabacterium sp. A7-Y TaxID=1349605 RepID=UPI00223E1A00|nr:phospholipase D-like domain-containing protein [Aquabacterium sp. A7-Y]MCW7536565.1 phospholipase D-like domain-containing protein [Aquabacterium sp. A7-Y]
MTRPDTPDTPGLPALLDALAASIADERLSDEEKRSLTQALRQASPPEDGLRQLRNRAFELVRERLPDPAQQALVKWLDGVVRALDVARAPAGSVTAQACFSPGEDCLHAIVGQLRSARRRIDICVFTLSDDRISEEVLAAHRRGVAVRLITDNEKEYDRGSDIGRLREAGIAVAVDRSAAHMHHKYAIFDAARLINGSYNWTRSACLENEENVVLCNDPALLHRFSEHFEQLWRQLAR